MVQVLDRETREQYLKKALDTPVKEASDGTAVVRSKETVFDASQRLGFLYSQFNDTYGLSFQTLLEHVYHHPESQTTFFTGEVVLSEDRNVAEDASIIIDSETGKKYASAKYQTPEKYSDNSFEYNIFTVLGISPDEEKVESVNLYSLTVLKKESLEFLEQYPFCLKLLKNIIQLSDHDGISHLMLPQIRDEMSFVKMFIEKIDKDMRDLFRKSEASGYEIFSGRLVFELW